MMKRGWKIAAGVLGGLTAAELTVLGWYGIGPLSVIKDRRMAVKPGNAAAYDFGVIQKIPDSPLKGKNVAVLGSSVVYGAASMQTAIAEYISVRFDCKATKEAVSGTTLTDTGTNSYVQRMRTKLDPNTKYDLFICQLSTNDATKGLPLGEVSGGTQLHDFDTATITGAMEYIIAYAKETWHCPVVFFTGSRYDSEAYGAMVTRLLELQEKWGIGVLNLWNDRKFNQISEDQRNVFMSDNIHPTKAGYRDWWGPEMERQLLKFIHNDSQE